MNASVRTRIAITGVVAALTLMFLGPAPPAVARTTGPTRTTSVGYALSIAPFRSGGWRWSFYASTSGIDVTLFATATRTATTGNRPWERHEWRWFDLPASDLSVDATDLLPTTLQTGTDMKIYGRFDGELTDASALSKKVSRCRATGDVQSRTWRRAGTLSGSFVFRPHVDGMPTKIGATALHASIMKSTYTGASCPMGCSPGKVFSGSLTDASGNAANVGARRSRTDAYIYLGYSVYDATNDVYTYHSVFGAVPLSAVTITSTAVTIKGGALAPFASGSLAFALSDPQSSGTKCVTTTYAVAYTSGTIRAFFVNGTEVFTAPFNSLSASATRKV